MMNTVNNSAVLMGLKDVVQSFGLMSLAIVPGLVGMKVCNQLIRKFRPSFNPKMTWASQGSCVQAIPSIVVAVLITTCITKHFRGYEISNDTDLLVLSVAAAVGVYVVVMLGRKKWTLA